MPDATDNRADKGVLEIVRLAPTLSSALVAFFERLCEAGEEGFFHPHPLTREEAERLCGLSGRDTYYVMVCNEEVLAYGMLRGWDEGYDIPSLGIAVLPTLRGLGLGRLMMRFLHAAARRRGAEWVRLTVCPDNTAATGLYESLGYEFDKSNRSNWVGKLQL